MSRFRSVLMLLLASSSMPALAVEPTATSILPAPQQVSEHVYAWIGPLEAPSKENQGYRMNMVFVVGDTAVVVLDTGYTEAMAGEMLAHIAQVTDRPVKFAINTNSQPHRIMGNEAFRRAGAEIIAHRDSAQRMDAQGGNFATAVANTLDLPAGSVDAPKKPDRIIDTDLSLELGGVTVNLSNYGPAHTPAQLVAGIPEDNVVYTSDLLYSQRLLAVLPESDIESWIEGFDRLKEFGAATFIPGHGEPDSLAAFEVPTRQYLGLLYEHMNRMVDEGVDAQTAIDELDQSRFSGLANFEELAGRNASWAYLEREAAAFD
ncbi:MAG: MBL fold metallo-hydrolase [Thiogranum sp.]|nr:MBL fold metallo-hydrolase [Thiogranum sp.]